MKNKALLFVSLLLLVVSCTSKTFSLSSVSLRRNIDMTGEVKVEEAVLSFDIDGGDGDDTTYTFLLVSPSGDLRWEGKVDKSGGGYSVDTLAITPGASFESGTYTLYVYSSDGGEVAASLDIAREEGNYTFENISKKNNAVIKYYDSNSFEIDDESSATWAFAEYTDRYSNRIKIIVDAER